jgi:hypothetical protein
MNFKRLLNTEVGRIFISVLLGIGLATLFRKVCNDKNCIIFNGPIISEFDNKIYKYGNKCYQYSVEPSECNTTKKIIDVENEKYNEDGTKQATPAPPMFSSLSNTTITSSPVTGSPSPNMTSAPMTSLNGWISKIQEFRF